MSIRTEFLNMSVILYVVVAKCRSDQQAQELVRIIEKVQFTDKKMISWQTLSVCLTKRVIVCCNYILSKRPRSLHGPHQLIIVLLIQYLRCVSSGSPVLMYRSGLAQLLPLPRDSIQALEHFLYPHSDPQY